jgi:hypothetical protein
VDVGGGNGGWYTDTNGFDHGFMLDGTTFTTVDYPTAGAINTQILGINAGH